MSASVSSAASAIEERVKSFEEVYLPESPTPSLADGEEPPHELVPPGSVLYSTNKRKSKSVVDQYGVRILYPKDEVSRCRWFCLMDSCFNGGKGSKLEIHVNSTCKATEHLSKKHGIVANKTVSAAANFGRLNKLIEVSTPGFRESPSRFYQLQFAAWAAEHSIPFNAFKGDSWNLIASTLPAVDRSCLKNLDVAKHQFEQYLCIKRKIIEDIVEARTYYGGVPFMSFNVDLYQNSVLNLKFIAVRLLWTKDGLVRSKNIGIRKYNPSFAQRDLEQASALLFKWTQSLLREFRVDLEEDVYTAIGDGGSDVRCVMENLMTGLREWCLGHTFNLCLIDAFGCHHEKSKSKNLEGRAVIEAVRKCIEQVNKSSKLKTKLEELLIVLIGQVIKLKNSPHHRWSAVEDVLRRVLQQWEALIQAYAAVRTPFPLLEYKQVLVEFYSLLVPVRKLQVKTQAMKRLTCVSSYWGLVKLYVKVLDEKSKLEILHPNSGEKVLDERPPHLLDPRTFEVRCLLREALFKRFFVRYHPIKAFRNWREVFGRRAWKNKTALTRATITLEHFKADYVLELQSMLHPRGRKLGPVKLAVCNIPINDYPQGFPSELKDQDRLRAKFLSLLECALWRHIHETLTRVYATLEDTTKPPVQAVEPPAAKKPKRQEEFEDIIDEAPSASSSTSSNQTCQKDDDDAPSPSNLAYEELQLWKSTAYDRSELTNPEHLLAWWGYEQQQRDYIGLPKVAGCLLAMKPGTGGLECDIGGVGDVVSPKRGSIDPGLVETAMMIKLNRTSIERDAAEPPRLGREWRRFIPGRDKYPADYFESSSMDDETPCRSSDEDEGGSDVCSDDDGSDSSLSGDEQSPTVDDSARSVV